MDDKTKRIIPNQEKAIFLAKRHLPEFVYDAVNLEGINYTLPEVKTLLDGVTVGGHKLSDATITLNQAAAWKQLFSLVENNQFNLSKSIACDLHKIAGQEESLEWGKFRCGGVTIAGTDYMPPPADQLNVLWEELRAQTEKINDVYQQAIFVFLQMARQQFFYDVNKRMGRFMMNGLLLQQGYPAINLPVTRQEEFNRLMLEFYPSGNCAPMTSFMLSCLDERVVRIMNESV